ncbi:MAG: CZB domain-containing protein [Spirochaetota bacterium]
MDEVHLKQRTQVDAQRDFFEQCDAAIAAHGEWKFKLLKAVDNRGEGLDAQKIALDNQCVFGRWLYSNATEPLRDEAHWQKVRSLHAEFHKTAAEVVTCCQAGEVERAKALIADNSHYALISAELAGALRAWVAERVRGASKELQQTGTAVRSFFSARKRALRAAALGALSGLAFVAAAITITCLDLGLTPSLAALIEVHRRAPVNFVVDTAPLVLGAVAYFLGAAYARLKDYQENLELLVARRTRELGRANNEMARVLDAMHDGVFILDKNRVIGQKVSRAAVEIFETTDIAGRPLTSILKGRISDSVERELMGYLDLLFEAKHSEKMLEDLNPLNPLTLATTEDAHEKIIRVRFSRLKNVAGEVESLLVFAQDITAETQLQRRLAAQERAANDQMALIRQIFSVGPQALLQFEHQMRSELDEVSALLRDHGGKSLAETREAIFRRIHNIKGSAALLQLTRIADTAHRYEDKLVELRQKQDLSTMDFLPLTVVHAELLQAFRELRDTVEKIREFQNVGQESALGATFKLLGNLVEKLAAEHNKPAELTLPQQVPEVSSAEERAIREIMVQFIRNSFAHGIESAAERERAGKDKRAQLTIGYHEKDGRRVFSYRDDGRGFDTEAIKERLVKKHMLTRAEADALSADALVRYIFHPGFSTKAEADATSGRGVGMDLVAEKVKQVGAKLVTRWQPGKYVEFQIVLPAVKAAAS